MSKYHLLPGEQYTQNARPQDSFLFFLEPECLQFIRYEWPNVERSIEAGAQEEWAKGTRLNLIQFQEYLYVLPNDKPSA